MLFQIGEEVEGVEGLQVIQVGVAEAFEDGAIQRGEHYVLIAVVVAGFGGAGREGFAEFVFGLFVALEDFAGAFDYGARESGEASYFDAITFVRAAGLDAAEKNDFVGSFFYGDVDVFDGGQEFG